MDAPVVFGSRARDRILFLLAIVGTSYPRELSRSLDISLLTVQRTVNDLERAGVLATRMMGRTRLAELNPRWFAAAELRSLLERLAESDPSLAEKAAEIRRRPGRADDPV
jgi:DNA-binding transcriptional ArsR family regulator